MNTLHLEFVLWDTDIRIHAYSPPGQRRNDDKENNTRPTEIRTRPPNTKRTPKEDALIISTSGKPLVTALKEIKKGINVDRLGAKIKGVRSTRGGELLLNLDKQGQERPSVNEEMIRQLSALGYTARLGRKERSVLHIKGMDAATEAEEVKAAITAALNETALDVKVGVLRPASGSRQNTTIEMEKPAAERLLQIGMIQIGWANCKIVERIQVNRCRRYWGLDHRTDACKAGVDRTRACMKCATEGHVAKEYQNDAFCPLCDAGGHRADTTACKLYRRAIEEIVQTRTSERNRRGGVIGIPSTEGPPAQEDDPTAGMNGEKTTSHDEETRHIILSRVDSAVRNVPRETQTAVTQADLGGQNLPMND